MIATIIALFTITNARADEPGDLTKVAPPTCSVEVPVPCAPVVKAVQAKVAQQAELEGRIAALEERVKFLKSTKPKPGASSKQLEDAERKLSEALEELKKAREEHSGISKEIADLKSRLEELEKEVEDLDLGDLKEQVKKMRELFFVKNWVKQVNDLQVDHEERLIMLESDIPTLRDEIARLKEMVGEKSKFRTFVRAEVGVKALMSRVGSGDLGLSAGLNPDVSLAAGYRSVHGKGDKFFSTLLGKAGLIPATKGYFWGAEVGGGFALQKPQIYIGVAAEVRAEHHGVNWGADQHDARNWTVTPKFIGIWELDDHFALTFGGGVSFGSFAQEGIDKTYGNVGPTMSVGGEVRF